MREIYFVLLVLNIILVLVGMFWLNEALFFISGYDPALAADPALLQEASRGKLPFLILVTLFSASLLAWLVTRKHKVRKRVYPLLMLINVTLTLSAITLLLLYLILPGRLL